MAAHRRCACTASLAAVLLAAGPGWAQASAADKAAAEALFAEGKKLMDAGDFAAACPKLAASEKLDHGIGILLYLADCYERNGQTASAWATFQEAAAEATTAGQAERKEIARVRSAALEPKLVRLTILVPASVQAMPGVEVRRDGQIVPPGAYGASIPVDPGQHLVEVTATGRGQWKGTVVVGPDNAKAELTLRDPPPLPVEPGRDVPPAVTAPPPDAPPPGSSGSAQRTVGVVIGGVGLAAIAGGSVLGLRAKSQYDDAREHCRTESFCEPEGLTGIDDARTTATVSTVLFAAGGGLLAVGVILFVSAPKASAPRGQTQPTVSARLSYGSARLEGTW